MKHWLIVAIVVGSASHAAGYELKDLSSQDMLTIGAGLDKLPREATDANQLYARIQRQLFDQDAARAAADRAKLEAEIRKTIEAEKAAPKGDGK
jgi:hypothetical protein